ncbi:MAG TPA: PD-(D/E)XK nuclease family protein, partial [Actinomycetota bacterium]|nr:PD-(D/E)XK nuclease family protein [Actinomycetota bacterium]
RDVDALVAFSHALGRFVERRRGRGTLEEYLDAITRADFGSDPWLPPERSRADAVQVLSFHAAKGKEWDIVAVCGVIEGVIPKGSRAQGLFDPYFLDDASAGERAGRNEAEDRRVFYVAMTRARKRCILSTSPGPSRKGQPSRFLVEFAGELPDVAAETDRPPLTFSEAAARARQVLSDTTAANPERAAALATIARICAVDPGCTAAQPAEWWWRWDWTEGAVPIIDQSFREEGMGAGKLRTSYSRIGNYDNCPLQYLGRTVLGLDPDITHHLHFGRWIHEIIEDCEKDPTEEQARLGRVRLNNSEMVFRRYEEVFDDSVFPNSAIARQFKADGRVMLRNYIEYLKPGTAALVEQDFTVDLDGHWIRGRIDRVDAIGKNLKVSDYKTSRSEAQWDEARDSLQLAIYYKAATEAPQLTALGKPVSMQLVYPFKVVKGDVSKRCQTPEEAEGVLERLPGLIEGVLAEDFAPSPEANCRWCKFKPFCPLWAEGKELQP